MSKSSARSLAMLAEVHLEATEVTTIITKVVVAMVAMNEGLHEVAEEEDVVMEAVVAVEEITKTIIMRTHHMVITEWEWGKYFFELIVIQFN